MHHVGKFPLSYHLPGRRGQHHRLDVLLVRVVVALKDGKGLMAGNRHNPLVVPALPDFPGHEGMPQVVKAQARQAGRPARDVSVVAKGTSVLAGQSEREKTGGG